MDRTKNRTCPGGCPVLEERPPRLSSWKDTYKFGLMGDPVNARRLCRRRQLGICWHIRAYLSLYGPTWAYMGVCGRRLFVVYGLTSAYMGPYGRIWAHMGLHGNI